MPKISELPADGTPDGSSLVPVVEGGVTKTYTVDALAASEPWMSEYVAHDRAAVGGEFAPPRSEIVSTAVQGSSGRLILWYFTASRTEDIGSITLWTGGTAAAATPTLCRVGVYSVAGDGALTLLAAIANDTALFGTTHTAYTRSLTSTFNKVAGQRYAIGVLVVSGGTVPAFLGSSNIGASTQDNILAIEPRLAARLDGQTDLPSSVANASLLVGRLRPIAQLHPL